LPLAKVTYLRSPEFCLVRFESAHVWSQGLEGFCKKAIAQLADSKRKERSWQIALG
jgi:hypothetical protein